MAKVREASSAGCVVSGEMRLSDGSPDTGSVTVVPNEAKVWQGRLISARPITVEPDAAGHFAVALPPGLYTLELSTMVVRIDVPDAASARLDEIMV